MWFIPLIRYAVSRSATNLRIFWQLLLSMCGFALAISVTLADSEFTLLEFSHDFGGQSVTRVSLGLVSRELVDPHYLGLRLPLYSTSPSELSLASMNATEGRGSFCERNPRGCLAFGVVIGVGIVYFASQIKSDDADRVQVSVSAGETSINTTSSQ